MNNHYYLDENNRPVGPFSLEEIQEKSMSGLLPSDLLVTQEGAAEWRRLGPPSSPPGFRLERVLPDAVASILHAVARVLNGRLINDSIDVARDVGSYAVVAAGGLAVICGIVAAIKGRSVMPLGAGLVLAVLAAGAQFVAGRSFAANDGLLASSKTRVSSFALLDCAGLLALLGAVSLMVGAVFGCVRAGAWLPLVPAAVTAAFWTYFGAVALHPESVNVAAGQASGGEEAVGLATFFLRALLKLLPLYFFAMAALGMLIAGLGLFDLAGPLLPFTRLSIVPATLERFAFGESFVGIVAAIGACLFPLIGYAVYIACSLPLDLWRALLGVPAKLDALKR